MTGYHPPQVKHLCFNSALRGCQLMRTQLCTLQAMMGTVDCTQCGALATNGLMYYDVIM